MQTNINTLKSNKKKVDFSLAPPSFTYIYQSTTGGPWVTTVSTDNVSSLPAPIISLIFMDYVGELV